MRIGHLNTADRVVVVAELGNNHEGDFARARAMVRAAAECGADAVKVQAFRTEDFVSPSDAARFARLQGFELAPEQFRVLADDARAAGVGFVTTPLDLGSADALEPFVDAFKVASSDLAFFPLLERLARSPKPLILSTGLSALEEVERAAAFVARHRAPGAELAILHCVSAYPTPPGQAQLGAIRALRQRFDAVIGYSDHTTGIDAAVLAVGAGARIIEKHFTLDKAQSDFRDHQLSADPPELRELIARVRLAEAMVGDEIKAVAACAADSVSVLQRSIAAAADLPRGHRIAAGDLRWVRPGGGYPAGRESELVGRVLARSVASGIRFTPDDLASES